MPHAGTWSTCELATPAVRRHARAAPADRRGESPPAARGRVAAARARPRSSDAEAPPDLDRERPSRLDQEIAERGAGIGHARRWRDGRMLVRWIAAALDEATRSFRRVRGHADLATPRGRVNATRRPRSTTCCRVACVRVPFGVARTVAHPFPPPQPEVPCASTRRRQRSVRGRRPAWGGASTASRQRHSAGGIPRRYAPAPFAVRSSAALAQPRRGDRRLAILGRTPAEALTGRSSRRSPPEATAARARTTPRASASSPARCARRAMPPRA